VCGRLASASDRESTRELVEASLDPLNPQSKLSPALLKVFRQILLQDRAYIDRLRRHYEMFKAAQRGPVSGASREPLGGDSC